MSLKINSDKEYIQGDSTVLIGNESFVIRSGVGSSEREVFRAIVDPDTNLPRVGVNRTGDRLDKILILNEGSGYTAAPAVIISPPDLTVNAVQATASSLVSNGRVIGTQIINPGSGYTSPPTITFQNQPSDITGAGAVGTSLLDTIEYEIDVNGAIRTSSSIISDTARVFNLDLDDLVTPDLDLRAPHLKVFDNKSSTEWSPNVSISKDEFRWYETNVYRSDADGITGTTPPLHKDGKVQNGNVFLEHVGYRVDDPNTFGYESFSWPRSVTPPLGDDSNKIATTEYVLNLATNDVGGRVYVSQQIGNDENDGRSAAAPVRTIKRGCQIATESTNVKETVIVAGGEYTEDNPISIPPDCAVVGDSLRIVNVRPNNPGKHMFKFADKNYISGLTFRDKLDSQGNPLSTWAFACVFDDKQRIYYDSTTGGDFKRRFPIGHQIFGENKFRSRFVFHNGTTNLIVGESLIGVNSAAKGTVLAVDFDSTTGDTPYQSGFVDFTTEEGNFNVGETVEYFVEADPNYTGWPSNPAIDDTYTHPNDGITYTWNGEDWALVFQFTAETITSIRPEGEVVETGSQVMSSAPIYRIDASQQAEVGGFILYTNALEGVDNIHDFHEGMEIFISGLQADHPAGDLTFLNGYQRIYDLEDVGVLTDDDSRSRRFVIPKDATPSITESEIYVAGLATQVSHYVTLSLLNSPNKFEVSPYVSRRFQDARNLIRNNLEFIKDEAYQQTLAEFTHFINPSETKCRRDIGHFVNAIVRDLEYGSNYHTIEAANYYLTGTGIGYVATELSETIRAFDIAKELSIHAMRGWRINSNGDLYNPQFSTIARYDDPDVTIDSSWPYCANVEAAINTLAYLFYAIITNNQVDRYIEAGYLIARNQEFIIQETSRYIEDQYPELFLSENASAARYKDSTNLIRNNRQEIIDRAVAEIAVQHPDFYYPDDAQTTSTSRYKDSYRLIQLNRTEIINTAYAEIAIVHPGFTNPDPAKCQRDIGYFVDAISLDLTLGGNTYARKFILQYFDNGSPISNGLVGEEAESITAFNKARDLMKLAITNNLTVKDLTITADPVTGSNTSTSSCANVQSSIDTLTGIVTTVINDGNLNNLPVENTGSIPDGEAKCKRDVGYIVDAVASDLYDGGNVFTIRSAKRYFLGASTPLSNGLVGETAESITAFNKARDMMKAAITNQLYYKDLTITGDPNPGFDPPPYGTEGVTTNNTNATSCSDVQASINTLISILTTVISEGDLDSLPEENTGDFLTTTTSKCRRDIGYILGAVRRDLILGGNAGIVTAGESYYTGLALTGIPQSELQPTREAFVKARDLAILAMRNWHTGTGAYTEPTYVPEYATTAQFIDSSVIEDTSTPTCANVASAITTSFALLDSILADGTTQTKTYGTTYEPVITYPKNTIYDADNKRVTIEAIWADLPFIEASPYIQNASVISFLGGGGCEIDGDKIRQPNCPRPGLKPAVGDAAPKAQYPNQGKSMVAAQFTIVSFGGTGYRIINDGYTQLVSVFVLFAQDGVLAESGGYASITNSATNFGTYALRAFGYRKDPYVFDIGTIANVSSTVTGRTIFTVDGLGREPLEHYIVKFEEFENQDPDIEYVIEAVAGTSAGANSVSSTITLNEQILIKKKSDGTSVPINNASLQGKTIKLHRPSIVNSSSHTWEYAGSGNDYNALPENGGTKREEFEQVSQAYGRVYTSGTDELGDFKVGYFAKIENRTGNITFTGTVSISEVEFLKLKGGDVVVTGFDASNTLGGNFSTDAKLPTQKAVKDYITNNLGQYINKPYSTNPLPRNLVELGDNGKISVEQIPPLRPFQVYSVDDEAARLALEGPLAGDIAIQKDNNQSFILNDDGESQYLSIAVDTALTFNNGDILVGSISTGQAQVTEYRQGVVYTLSITNAGTGYDDLNPPTVTFSAPSSGVSAAAEAVVVSGRIVSLSLISFSGYIGGYGYDTAPTVTIAAPGGGGTQATASCLIESRIYTDILNNIKIAENDVVIDSSVPTNNVTILRTTNTSASNPSNWVSLSTTTVDISNITGTTQLATGFLGTGTANSTTFLRGDSTFAEAVQSIKPSETRYFAYTSDQAAANQDQIRVPLNSEILLGHGVVANGIPAGTTVQQLFQQPSLGGGTDTVIILSQSLTQLIPINSIIEFTRPASPVLVNSTFTASGFIDKTLVAQGGTSYTDGNYYDVALIGGTGNGLKANIFVSSGSITAVTVTSGGIGYDADFSISGAAIPTGIIGPGTGAVIEAKLNTTVKSYANIGIDIKRADDKTLAAEEYGNTGIARFFKSQFFIGEDGDGSVKLKTGADSGLDADKLDGQEGNYYLNGSNFVDLSITPAKLSSDLYGIDISGQSGNTLRLTTSTGNASSSPGPSGFNEGITADTRNNTADGLSDGGSKHGVITYRQFGSAGDASGGGVRQLAFTDNNNLWIRGSGTGVSTFGSWAKIWTSLNDGADTGLDADKLDGKQGAFFQNAFNISQGFIGSDKLSSYQNELDVQTALAIVNWSNQVFYDIHIEGQILSEAPFVQNATLNLYDNASIEVGEFIVSEIVTYNDVDDALDYSIIKGRLSSGNINAAVRIGTPSTNITIANTNKSNSIEGSTFDVARLEGNSGTAILKLGRTDGTASTPSIYFNSSASPATYNVRLQASGGTGTAGSGALDVDVSTFDSLTVKGQKVWNAGNVTFDTLNTASTAVIRDASGNFSAGTITASLTGAASLNVLSAGGEMTGNLTFSAGNGIVINTSANSQASGTGNRNLTILNPTVGADAYLTFHVSGDYAGYFGLDGATNDLFWGGWSVGSSTKYTILHTGNNPVATANTANTLVKRDGSGNFSAGTITATLSGNASTATKLATARDINGVSFDGSANITITASTSAALSVGTYLRFGDGTGTQSFDGGTARTINVLAATANTASTLVARDASGNFSAGTITATLSGNASSATKSTNISGGGAGSLPYQSGADTTSFLAAGTAGYFLKQGTSAPEWTAFPIGGADKQVQYNNSGALAGSAQFTFTSATHSILQLGSTSSFRQSSTSPWGGNPGAGVGKLEYHSGRWYVVSGSDSNEVARFRRDGTDVAWIANDGAFTTKGDITAFSTSDNRLKVDIKPIENALNKIDKISGVTYNWNELAEGKDQTKRESGVIAQEILEVLPEVVTERDNGYLAVQYERLVPLLIQAIKELKQEVETLKVNK